MWKMDLIHNYNGKTVKLNKIDHETVGVWLHENKLTIKYDYKHKSWKISGSVDNSKFLDLVSRVGSSEDKLKELTGE